ncbi:MAG: hypothetical protein ACREH8_24325 [Opitutaceae bacterium]
MHSNEPRDPLADVLQRWRVQPPRTHTFHGAVWQRIDRLAPMNWSSYIRGHLLGWSVTAMLALMVAGWGGHEMAQARLDAERNAMVISYLSGLDPRVLTKLRP